MSRFYKVEDVVNGVRSELDFILINKEVISKCSLECSIVLGMMQSGGIYTHKELGDYLDIDRNTVAKHLKTLEDHGYIRSEKFSQRDIFEMLITQNEQYICEWCNKEVSLLEEHHYPIPKRDGGEDIVNICPNCHKMFHKIELSQNGGW